MTFSSPLLFAGAFLALAIYRFIIQPLYTHPLRSVPGPTFYALTRWRLAWEDLQSRRTRTIHALHRQYGSAVRIGPNEVHFNSLSALKKIYGPGSPFGRTSFYRMFDAYGEQNLFTFHSSKQHGERKKLLANVYSKSNILKGRASGLVSEKVQQYLDWISSTEGKPEEIFKSLHYYSLDSITAFIYGPSDGGTSSMKGNASHQALLDDIINPSRRRLTWCAVHFPRLVKWLYTRTGLTARLVTPFLPMQKPTTYTGIRAHALAASQGAKGTKFEKSAGDEEQTILGRLYHLQSLASQSKALTDLQIASECADHFLAGIDTTSDTLMFMLWALSRPQNSAFQQKLMEESLTIPAEDLDVHGNPTVEAADKLPYLNAVINETLRLYAPLPGSEARSADMDVVVDGYLIPAGSIVNMAPYSLHRNAAVFEDPLSWNPDRWLVKDAEKLAEMKRWFWPFSSGGRMCIGMHLATAEMAVVPAIYRKYSTSIAPGFEAKSPGIVSRVEVFGDESFDETEEHTCWINFVPT
ncbi:related to pisatin demethylase cytochrome P450 [Ramularia collo-cygni]|uniref:Related to pisatin demethylase cytochrome P450 n=1 Tax=Ramularia collo-cygni TaxID=112498 RepID=A0A2D3VLR6_9PEZI|nr:related to pisatin demethylase cytochrome P450 [Ramularia collo-cygni]CZT25816.1 related to pisatin demethylase cytochrome P450 [Ramularia collo-cygni]